MIFDGYPTDLLASRPAVVMRGGLAAIPRGFDPAGSALVRNGLFDVSESRKRRRRAAVVGFRAWHCQMTRMRTLSERSVRRTVRSRLTVFANFFDQNSELVAGTGRPSAQPCRCQKQPCTKTAHRTAGNQRSGVPVMCAALVVKRRPINRASRRTSRSGFVPAGRMRDMFKRRCAGVRTSVNRRRPRARATYAPR